MARESNDVLTILCLQLASDTTVLWTEAIWMAPDHHLGHMNHHQDISLKKCGIHGHSEAAESETEAMLCVVLVELTCKEVRVD